MTHNQKAPIIVGGVGGSGTRAVAAILERAGVYTGSYLNVANDNVHFARMISNHSDHWKQPYSALKLRLHTFTRLFFGQSLNIRHLLSIYGCVQEPRLRETWLLIHRSRGAKVKIPNYPHWGFKNPRSCFFLPQLNAHYPECKYIHVIRHGLDMAFSSNTEPLRRWGREFGIVSTEEHFTAQHQIAFWIAVNRYVLGQCQELIADRHYILNFDRLCTNSEQEIEKLLTFLSITPSVSIEELSQLVALPASAGRYRTHLSEFTSEQIQAVRDLGFDVG